MPKRKQAADSEEEDAFETPSEDERPKKSKQKARLVTSATHTTANCVRSGKGHHEEA